MQFNQKLEKHAEPKLKCLMDSESVAKDKCYKLGVWLHGEYRDKFKKAVDRSEQVNREHSFH